MDPTSKNYSQIPRTTIPTLILGLGNPLRGDDGSGTAVLEALSRIASLLRDVALVCGGTGGLDIVLQLQGYQRAIIIDAADFGGAPGEWRCFALSDVNLLSENLGRCGSLHHAGLAEALALGEALGTLPEELVIYGIQPRDIRPSIGLSPPVLRAIQEICIDIQRRLSGINCAYIDSFDIQ